jgi:hypothetical protein
MRQTCRSYYMLQPLQARYAMLKPEEIRYAAGGGTVTSSQAFLGGDWRNSQVLVRYPGGLCVWVNGNASRPWRVEHEGVTHELPPFGWLAVAGDGFFESSEAVEGKRCDRAVTPECLFLDGRGTWRQFEGIGASGSVAVRRDKASRGLSITTIEGVDRLVLERPQSRTTLKVVPREDSTTLKAAARDVRTAIGAIAQSDAVTARAFDLNEKDLGEVAIRRTAAGWELRPPQTAVRLDVRVILPVTLLTDAPRGRDGL